jgi:hypothetical protein
MIKFLSFFVTLLSGQQNYIYDILFNVNKTPTIALGGEIRVLRSLVLETKCMYAKVVVAMLVFALPYSITKC